jgi:hypothetical protein
LTINDSSAGTTNGYQAASESVHFGLAGERAVPVAREKGGATSRSTSWARLRSESARWSTNGEARRTRSTGTIAFL